MVHLRSKLSVVDNSGIQEVRCIQVKRGRFGRIGSDLTVAVKKVLPTSSYKKGEVVHGIMVSSKKGLNRSSGICLRFEQNSMVILNKKREPVGTRILSTLPIDLRKKGMGKLLTQSDGVV